MSVRSLVKRILIRKENKRYEKLLSARQMTYGQWIRRTEIPTAGGIEEEPDDSIAYFVSSEGVFAENGMQSIEGYFREHPEAVFVYGDEDVLEDGQRRNPWFKPDWSPHLLDSCFYFGSVAAMRVSLLERTEEIYETCYGGRGRAVFSVASTGQGKRIYRVTDLIAYEKWIHICVGEAGGYQVGSRLIGHVPEILFHCDGEREQRKYLHTSEYLRKCDEECLRDFGEKMKIKRNAATDGRYHPAVSVVVPSKDHPKILETCLKGILKVSGRSEDADRQAARNNMPYVPCEIIIVDNGSREENRARIQETIKSLCLPDLPITYLYLPMEFNFSRMCNLGAEHASGDFLLFLNDDVELCVPECIARMVALADRFDTGAVGMKLYYPDSRRIQHAGITNLPMGPVHKLQFLEDDQSYYFDSNRGLRNVTAVTAACLMVEKEKFTAAGGFAEELQVAFNDVDFCFTLYEMGYRNVCINSCYAYHHESLSRGDDESAEKTDRLLTELDRLYRRHPEMEGIDPYYSVRLNREGLDTRIRPAFETAGNRIQQIKGRLKKKEMKGYRQDNCVLFRVESARNGILQGYGVILGDDNACYDREILLIPENRGEMTEFEEKHTFSNIIYCIPVEGQYRPDLTENMRDQVNVGLSGFWIEMSKKPESDNGLPPGRYRIGIAVRNRVTGLRLMNSSNRYVTVLPQGEDESFRSR